MKREINVYGTDTNVLGESFRANHFKTHKIPETLQREPSEPAWKQLLFDLKRHSCGVENVNPWHVLT